jgi:transporter family protein
VGWVGWSLVALLGWGAWAVLNKLALRTLQWPHLIVASWMVSTILVLVLLAIRIDPRPLASRDGVLALAAAATSLIAVIAFYLAIRSGPLATVTPLSSLYPAVTAILAVVFLREHPSALQWTGVGVAIAAGLLLSRP